MNLSWFVGFTALIVAEEAADSFWVNSKNDITNSNIYLLYNSITDAIKNVDQNINSQNNTTLHNSLQDQYISNLQNLYDDNYYYLKYNIYGKDWCDKEIEKYTKLFKDKLTKQKEIVARLKTNFGDNWQT